MSKVNIYTAGKVVEVSIQSIEIICGNPYQRGQRIARLLECETDKEDCLDLYEFMSLHAHVLLTTTEGEKYECVSFTDSNRYITEYLHLTVPQFPFAYFNYAEHRELCAEFNEPAPSLGQYVVELFEKSRPVRVNAFVQQPDGQMEFFNGIAVTESTENNVDEDFEVEGEELELEPEEKEEE